jgi:hypothetical protein
MKAEREADGGCLLRLSKEDLDGLFPIQHTPESHAETVHIIIKIYEDLLRAWESSPTHPYAKDVTTIYELFAAYWNPDEEVCIKGQLERWLIHRDIILCRKDNGDSYVKLLTRNGQTPFVTFLLTHMKQETFKQVSLGRAFARLKSKLAATLWYLDHPVTVNSMSQTLRRAVKQVAKQ